jgi:hypothetical protein
VASPRTLEHVRRDQAWPSAPRDALQAALDQALQRDLGQRTATPGGLARALQAAVTAPASGGATGGQVASNASKASGAKAAAPSAGGSPGSGRPAWMLPVAALVVVGVGVGGWVALRRPASPPPPPPEVTVLPPQGSAPASGATASGATATGAVATPDVPAGPDRQVAVTSPPNRRTGPAIPGGAGAATPGSAGTRGASATPPAGDAKTPRQRLDSLSNLLVDPATGDERTARRLIPQIRGLIAQLRTASDSTWGYLRLAEAHLMAGEEEAGCLVLNQARDMARSATQLEAIRSLLSATNCR